mgnify:CR=1 FL=1
MQEHQEKYGDYMRQIAKNEPDVVITNARELGKMENDSVSVISRLKGDVSSLEGRVKDLESTEKSQSTNIENMRKYIKTLEEEVSTKSEDLL